MRAGNKAGTRVLAAEEDLGRDLVSSLSGDQKRQLFWILTCQVTYLQAAEKEISPLENSGVRYEIWILGKKEC